MRISTTTVLLLALVALFVAPSRACAQTGACCDDLSGTCQESVPVGDCMGFSARFIAGGACSSFNPPCGVGLCCTPSTCAEATHDDCVSSLNGYFWLPAQYCDGLDCTDCDGNDFPDAYEIQVDPSLDCNQNGVLDRCEIDANSTAPGGPFFCTTSPCANDCNNNGLIDECEIYEFTSAPGGPYFCTDSCAADYNDNGVLDSCDIDPTDPDGDGNVSEDTLDPIGVPDEVRIWTGAVNDLWSEPGNWLPASVPNNTPDAKFSVVIDGSFDGPSANVEADADVTVSSLVLRDNSVLTLTQGDLTLEGPDGIVDEGLLVIPDGRTLHANDSIRLRGAAGVIRLAGDTAAITSEPGAIITNEVEIQGRGLLSANLRNALVGTISANDAGPNNTGRLAMSGPTTFNNGALNAQLRATLLIVTDVAEEVGAMSTISVIGATVKVGDGGDDGDDPEVVDGCGPIVLRPTDVTRFTLDRGQLLNFTRWEIGDNTLTLPNQQATFEVLNSSVGVVDGPVLVRSNGTLTVDASRVEATSYVFDDGATFSATNSAIVTSRGDFRIAGSNESRFNFATGTTLAFEGGTIACGTNEWDRTLEAAGRNFGAGLTDGGYDNNFDFARLRIEANARVELVDNVDNGNRPLDGAEAVYCDELTLEPGAKLFLNGIALFAGGQQVTAGPFDRGEVVERQACCLSDVDCTMEILQCCASLGGTAFGIGTTCASVDCSTPPPNPAPVPTGACCISDGSCNETTELDCTDGGASYQGDDTSCDSVGCAAPAPAPSTDPVGACCLADQTCMDLTRADCTAINGEFFGSNSNCGVTNCTIGDGPAAQMAPDATFVDQALCRLLRQTLCGIPGCAPCGALSLLATLIGIRRMRRRKRSRR